MVSGSLKGVFSGLSLLLFYWRLRHDTVLLRHYILLHRSLATVHQVVN